jgi:hypothetical protein
MAMRATGRAGQLRLIAIAGALACAGAVLVIVRSGSAPTPTALLTSGRDFGISGTVRNLAPGVTTNLVLTVTNPYRVAISVTSVTVSVHMPPSGCPASDLLLGDTAFSGTPPAVTISGLSQEVPRDGSAVVPLPILLARSAPDRCQHVTFPFRYSATARYRRHGRAAATVTVLASHPDPSRFGHRVRFTAIVRFRHRRNRRRAHNRAHSRPAGTVTFYLCIRPSRLPPGAAPKACRKAVPMDAPVAVNHSGLARIAASALPPGRHPIFASFTPANPAAYSASVSRTIVQLIGCGRPSITAPAHGSYRVRPGRSTCPRRLR